MFSWENIGEDWLRQRGISGGNMKLKDSQVLVSPRIVCWYGLPSHITEKEKFNFLKHDIFLFSPENHQLAGLRGLNSRKSAFIFNLDHYLAYFPAFGDSMIYLRVQKLAKFLSLFCSHNSLVYSRILDEGVAQIFADYGIQFMQADLQYRETTQTVLNTCIMPLISHPNRKPREFVRIHFSKESQIRVSVRNLTHQPGKVLNGTIKDLSLNGMAISFRDYRFFRGLQLRDRVSLQLKTNDYNINFRNAFITRRKEYNEEIGVHFNLLDKAYIDRQDAELITKLIYNVLATFADTEIESADKRLAEIALVS